MQGVKKIAQKDLNWAVLHRRHIHQHPELSNKEKKTSSYCQSIMKDLGLEVIPLWEEGFVADLKVKQAKKTIAWRTELDALPIFEKNTHEFVSKNQGVAHMCGHDMHMAIALFAAKLLVSLKDKLTCNIRFIFQPSEEKPPGGALEMIKQGCLEGVDEIFSLHNDLTQEIGKVSTKTGPITSAVSIFRLLLIGKGTHSAMPHLGLDPLSCAMDLVNHWKGIILRKINPINPLSFCITKFMCGNTFNVIVDEAELAGSIRSYKQEDLFLIEKLMRQSLKGLEEQGYKCMFNYEQTYAATINSEKGVERVLGAAKKIVGKENVFTNVDPTTCSEDFCYYLQKIPGAFFFLGAKNHLKKIVMPQHSPYFDVDEEAIALGAAIMVELALQSG